MLALVCIATNPPELFPHLRAGKLCSGCACACAQQGITRVLGVRHTYINPSASRPRVAPSFCWPQGHAHASLGGWLFDHSKRLRMHDPPWPSACTPYAGFDSYNEGWLGVDCLESLPFIRRATRDPPTTVLAPYPWQGPVRLTFPITRL